MTFSDDTSGVKVPPPLFYVSGFAAGALLERALAVVPNWGHVVVNAGWFLIAASLLLLASAVTTLWRAGTTVLPDKKTTALVTGGPYRFSRNPIYVAMTILYVGVDLVANMVAPLLFLTIVLPAISRYVITREENYMLRLFGNEYMAYQGRVRRWL